MNWKFTGVWRTYDKPAGDDVKPVNDVIVQLHCIESCRSVLEGTLKTYVDGSTFVPGATDSKQQ